MGGERLHFLGEEGKGRPNHIQRAGITLFRDFLVHPRIMAEKPAQRKKHSRVRTGMTSIDAWLKQWQLGCLTCRRRRVKVEFPL